MQRRLISHDPITGLNTWHDYDYATDTTTISYSADSQPVLEANKRRANDVGLTREGIKDDFWFYASVPVEVQLDWMINKGVDVTNRDHAKEMFKLLNDPEYRYLKATVKHHTPK